MRILLIIVFFGFIFSCTWLNEEELYPDQLCDTTDITYTLDIKPIFQANCYSCHSSTGPYSSTLDLENFTQIQRVVDDGKLLQNIKHLPGGTPMPYGGTKLSDCKILKIENWIEQGIPNN